MSHVTEIKTVKIKDIQALRDAVAMNPKLELIEGKTTYRTWISDHGRLEGDYPVPAGHRAKDLGKNAKHVIRLKDRTAKVDGVEPYEIGVVESKTEPGTFSLMYDFFNQGYGIEPAVGKNCDDLLMHYQMQVARREAEAQGDSISFQQEKDGSYTAHVDTYVRLGV